LLSAGTLGLGGEADTDEAVLGLELLHGLGGVVDECETSGLAATELGAEAEDGDLVLLGLVEATELLAELLLGDIGAVGVEDVTRKSIVSPLIPSQETICQPASMGRDPASSAESVSSFAVVYRVFLSMDDAPCITQSSR